MNSKLSSFVSHPREDLLIVIDEKIKKLKHFLGYLEELSEIRSNRIREYVRTREFSFWFIRFTWEETYIQSLSHENMFYWDDPEETVKARISRWNDDISDLQRLKSVVESTKGEDVYLCDKHADMIFSDASSIYDHVKAQVYHVPDGFTHIVSED